MGPSRAFDVLIVGGGPAGMAAACCAAQGGRSVAVVDDNPTPGGQIWRGRPAKSDDRLATHWFRKLQRAGVELLAGTQVVDQSDGKILLAETPQGACTLQYDRLIVATGARERFLPFPGWTLPNVTGAGGLQSLAKSGLPIAGKRVVVAGSGPLLLAVAAYLRRNGAGVRLILEQASWSRLLRFGIRLIGSPAKLIEGAAYKLALMGVRYAAGSWVTAAEGDRELSSVAVRAGRHTWDEPCDYLACSFGFVPNLELPALLGCRLDAGGVRVDPWQQTSVPDVYCAGEATGIGGVDLSLIEGQIAGHAAAGRRNRAAGLFAARKRGAGFARNLQRAFALRDELRGLASAETLLCRCEDVTRGRLQQYDSWRAAKRQTRCGMGACQGRVCGAATEFLFGWTRESVRPPIFPTRLENLVNTEAGSKRPGP